MPARSAAPPGGPLVRAIGAQDEARVLALNAAHAVETSELSLDGLRALLGIAFAATTVGSPCEAFLLAHDDASGHPGWNFGWVKAHLDRFVYVDRIVTDPAARGRGHARALYADLEDRARRAGHHHLACEVNLDPPNAASDAFHAALGFAPIGTARLPYADKTVRYLAKRLTPPRAAGPACLRSALPDAHAQSTEAPAEGAGGAGRWHRASISWSWVAARAATWRPSGRPSSA